MPHPSERSGLVSLGDLETGHARDALRILEEIDSELERQAPLFRSPA